MAGQEDRIAEFQNIIDALSFALYTTHPHCAKGWSTSYLPTKWQPTYTASSKIIRFASKFRAIASFQILFIPRIPFVAYNPASYMACCRLGNIAFCSASVYQYSTVCMVKTLLSI